MPRAGLIFVLFLVLSTASPSSSGLFSGQRLDSDQQRSAPSSLAETLLDTSYDLIMTGKISGVDRIRSLNDLVIVAPEIVPPKKVKEWATKLIELANDPNTDLSASDRMAFRKNAVVAICKVDSDLAMVLFSELGPAPRNEQQQMPEDIRAFGARVVFLKYFRDRGPGSLERIRKASENLAADGTYPFHAISLIIGELTGQGKDAIDDANKLFENALDHYYCPPKADNQELEFYTLLQSAKPVVSTTSLQKAVRAYADHLTSPSCDTGPKPYVYAALIETSMGKVKVADSRKALLFRSLSFINSVDDALGSKLKSEHAELAFADATINHVWSAYYTAKASAAEQQEAEKTGLQKSLTQGIARVRESNPDAALEMTEQIKDKGTKTVQIASILPSLAQKDLQRSKQLYTAQLNDLNSLEEGLQKTRATLWMAEAAYNAEDFSNFRHFSTKTFADAIKAFDDSYTSGDDQTPVDQRPGYSELAEFVKFSSAHGISWPLDDVKELSNIGLKARLLISAAVGLSHP